jgi:hypothetical protein
MCFFVQVFRHEKQKEKNHEKQMITINSMMPCRKHTNSGYTQHHTLNTLERAVRRGAQSHKSGDSNDRNGQPPPHVQGC